MSNAFATICDYFTNLRVKTYSVQTNSRLKNPVTEPQKAEVFFLQLPKAT